MAIRRNLWTGSNKLANYASFENWLKDTYIKNDKASAFRFKVGQTMQMLNMQSHNTGGHEMHENLQLGGSSAHSKTFAVSQALSEERTSNEGQFTRWTGNTAVDYCVYQISIEDMERAHNDRQAFVNKHKQGIDDALTDFWNKFCVSFWGPGDGKVAIIKKVDANTTKTFRRVAKNSSAGATVTSTHVLEVESPEQIRSIQPGAYLDIRSPAGGQRIGSESIGGLNQLCYVVAVTYGHSLVNLPKIYIKATAAPAIAVNDVIYKAGDYNQRTLHGIQSWLPITAPTSDLFFGVDRTQYPEMLGGFRETLTGTASVNRAIDRLMAETTTFGDPNCQPTHLFMHPFMQRALQGEVMFSHGAPAGTTGADSNSEVMMRYPDRSGMGRNANMGYNKLFINVGNRTMPLVLDPWIPMTRIYGLYWPGVKVRHLSRKLLKPVVDDETGRFGRLRDTQMAFEYRWVMFPEMFMPLPGKNFVIETKDLKGLWNYYLSESRT